jgi:hypothetical protein
MNGLEGRLNRIERQLDIGDKKPGLRIPASFFGDDRPFDMPDGFVEIQGVRSLLDIAASYAEKEQYDNRTRQEPTN